MTTDYLKIIVFRYIPSPFFTPDLYHKSADMRSLLVLSVFLILGFFAQAQSKPKTTTPASMPELPKLISTMGLPYNVVNDSIVVIPYEGEHVPDFKVIIQKTADLYIVYCNLSEALPGKLEESKHKYLLQRNSDFDMIKIGLAEEGYTMRIDMYSKGMTSATLKRLISQVANVTNIIGGDLK